MRRGKLDANTWAQLDQLLDAALDLPPSERLILATSKESR